MLYVVVCIQYMSCPASSFDNFGKGLAKQHTQYPQQNFVFHIYVIDTLKDNPS